jgi:hypothetical protein
MTPAEGLPSGAETERASAGAARGLPVARRQPPRVLVRGYSCPRCDAAAGQPCTGRRGPRASHHIERVERATALQLGQRLVLPRSSWQDARPAGGVKRSDPEERGVDTAEEPADCPGDLSEHRA